MNGQVRILVDGRDYSDSARVSIRPAFLTANRYWGYIRFVRLVDREERTERLVVTQRVGGKVFRSVSVGADGVVEDERFSEDALPADGGWYDRPADAAEAGVKDRQRWDLNPELR